MKSFTIKFCSFMIALYMGMGCLLIQSCKNRTAQSEDRYGLTKFMTSFSDSTAFAMINVGDTPVLLVSNETYINQDDNQQPVLNAIAAQVYMLDEADKVVSLGEVRSQGTLYPVSFDGEALLTAGHRFMNRFAAQGNSLSILESIYGELKDGTTTYVYENRVTDQYANDKDEAFFEQMMSQFEAAQPVAFKMGVK